MHFCHPHLVRSAFISTVLFCAAANISSAQVLHLESSESRALGSSDLTSSLTGTLTINPALTSGNEAHTVAIGLAVTPNEQGLSNAYTAAVEGAFYAPSLGVSFSAGAAQLAFSSSYADVDAVVGIAKVFSLDASRHVAVGARFRYESLTYQSDYAPVKFYLLDLGFSFDATSDFSIGGAALNLLGAGRTLGSGVIEERPAIFMLGATYHPSDAPVALYSAIEAQDPFPLAVHLGMSYTPVDFLSLHAGTTTDTGTLSAGASIVYDPLVVDLAIRFDHAFGSIVTLGLAGRW